MFFGLHPLLLYGNLDSTENVLTSADKRLWARGSEDTLATQLRVQWCSWPQELQRHEQRFPPAFLQLLKYKKKLCPFSPCAENCGGLLAEYQDQQTIGITIIVIIIVISK